MTNDGWDSKWPSGAGWFDKPKLYEAPRPRSEWDKDVASVIARSDPKLKDWHTHTSDIANSPQSGIEGWPEPPPLTGLDLATGDRTVLTTLEKDGIKHRVINQTELKAQGSNLVDDQQYLYFQCGGCGEILDPNTKSFKTLDEKRYAAGWKVKWHLSGMGYEVYCVKCGEKV